MPKSYLSDYTPELLADAKIARERAPGTFCTYRFEWLTFVRCVAIGGKSTNCHTIDSQLRTIFQDVRPSALVNGRFSALDLFGRALLHLESLIVEDCHPESQVGSIVEYDPSAQKYVSIPACSRFSRAYARFLADWLPRRFEWRQYLSKAKRLSDVIRLLAVFETSTRELRKSSRILQRPCR